MVRVFKMGEPPASLSLLPQPSPSVPDPRPHHPPQPLAPPAPEMQAQLCQDLHLKGQELLQQL